VKNRFEALPGTLLGSGIEFVLVGGVAAVAHGSARATFDVDVVHSRSPENLRRIVNVLQPLDPCLRGVPSGLPFRFDVQMLERGLNFTLTTSLGDLDLPGEIAELEVLAEESGQ